jgi:hypothetical protein
MCCFFLAAVAAAHSADQTRWYRDANGNFFIPIPTKRDEDVAAADPMSR